MKFIAHRINTLEQLKAVPRALGCEVDLRDRGERLILQHDPFTDGQDVEPFFEQYRHSTLILNIKSERIEHRVSELLRRYEIEDYFFLDSSLPMIVSLTGQGERRVAIRYSEYESIETVLNFQGRLDWVWVDCFTRLPGEPRDLIRLAEAGFKTCLVSPELQGRPDDIESYRTYLEHNGVTFDAICTKLHNLSRWQ